MLNHFISVLYILGQEKYSIGKKCLQFITVEVTIHSYFKPLPKMEATS